MQMHFPWLVAVLALAVSAPAMGQTSTDVTEPDAVVSSAVGHWLYSPDGTKIGSVRRLSDNGQTAVIMVGLYFQPGSHEATLPVTALSVANGKGNFADRNGPSAERSRAIATWLIEHLYPINRCRSIG